MLVLVGAFCPGDLGREMLGHARFPHASSAAAADCRVAR